ncbi:MAG: PKD domain-containing protein [Crocinitomicaceae bacterium]|nr:PKD domain-containing protein [Crocinitomicaceae bacterium]
MTGTVGGATTTGQWSGGSGTYSPNNTNLNAGYIPTPLEVTAGTVSLTLTSTNNGTCVSVSDVVQITFIAPPFANFNFSDVCLEETVNFTDFSLNGYGTISAWDWNFDDGSSSSTQNNSHLYSSAGSCAVELIVSSDAGCSDTTTQNVQVFELPVADFNYTSSCDNNLVILDFTDNSTTQADPLNYWYYDFGGQGSQLPQIHHSFLLDQEILLLLTLFKR